MVSSDSKITFFLTFMVLAIITASCNKKNDVIPDVYVDFYLDLNDPQFVKLSSFGETLIVTSSTNNLGVRAAGYDGNGIIIFAGVDEYYAYDRTCPHDYATNGTSIKVNIDPTNSLNAICPVCKTNYSLSAGGVPSKGIGRYPLKNYKTSFDGRNVRVWNY
jgi:nitrite reductase/ring-hydroxylating ferredoxin subunit